MSALDIYSGEVRLGQVGIAAPFLDMAGKPLATGDIVVIWPDRHTDFTLSVVVVEDDEFFVMGLKSIDLSDQGDDGSTYWHVQKVKDHRDVIAGEHWTAWGFNYRAAEVRP